MKGFRAFILRGNVVDLAVAVLIGAAFGALVTAFTRDFITPILAAIGGKPDFSSLSFTINEQHVPLRRLHQRADLVPDHRGGAVLPGHPAGEQADGAYKTEPEPALPTRDCPECYSSIPQPASRCAFCSTEVTPVAG